jgi:hypothetical protein
MRPTWFVFGILTLTIRPAEAQVPAVRVDSIKGRLELVFPVLPLGKSGCRYSGNVSAETGRVYSWEASTVFPDSRYPNNHIFSLEFYFFFPDTLELSETRFDSIVAATPIQVAEVRGEPPIFGTSYRLDHSSVRRDKRHLTLLIQGRQAVDALLRTGTRTVGLSWCEGSQSPVIFRAVPLQRH